MNRLVLAVLTCAVLGAAAAPRTNAPEVSAEMANEINAVSEQLKSLNGAIASISQLRGTPTGLPDLSFPETGSNSTSGSSSSATATVVPQDEVDCKLRLAEVKAKLFEIEKSPPQTPSDKITATDDIEAICIKWEKLGCDATQPESDAIAKFKSKLAELGKSGVGSSKSSSSSSTSSTSSSSTTSDEPDWNAMLGELKDHAQHLEHNPPQTDLKKEEAAQALHRIVHKYDPKEIPQEIKGKVTAVVNDIKAKISGSSSSGSSSSGSSPKH